LSLGDVAGVLAAVAAVSAWRNHSFRAEILLGVSMALLFGGIASREFLIFFHKAWSRAGRAIASVNTFMALAILFWAGFGFYRCWGRIVGRDPLGRRSGRRESYWVPIYRTRQQPWQFERLY
jgi:hypothetical protein